jgi:hypothetical protein
VEGGEEVSILYGVRTRLYEGYTNRDEPKFVQVVRKGVRYDLGGEVVELFRVKFLAEALDRTVTILKKWEAKGWLPRPIYQIEGDQCTHWYSAAQVINCHRLMVGRYRGRKYLPTEDQEAFYADVRKVWAARDIVVGEDGLFIKDKAS